jgi:hypothetical protein
VTVGGHIPDPVRTPVGVEGLGERGDVPDVPDKRLDRGTHLVRAGDRVHEPASRTAHVCDRRRDRGVERDDRDVPRRMLLEKAHEVGGGPPVLDEHAEEVRPEGPLDDLLKLRLDGDEVRDGADEAGQPLLRRKDPRDRRGRTRERAVDFLKAAHLCADAGELLANGVELLAA